MTNTSTTPRIVSPWLTKAEAAEYARVSTRTIDRWRTECGLEYGGSPRAIRIHIADLDKFLERNKASRLGGAA